MSQQTSVVQKFFDDLAPEYGARYKDKNAYYQYFFNQRLEAAAYSLNLCNVHIFDIGAGTGAIYDYLQNNAKGFEYLACDLSQSMLDHSNIPPERRIVGQATEIDLQEKSFDYIFMLGVSSYMQVEDFVGHLIVIERLLQQGGKAIISFTHSCSLDNFLRRIFQKFSTIVYFKTAKRKLLGQPFQTKAYCFQDIQALLSQNLVIAHHQWLNQTISPFNHIFPHFSVSLAKYIKKNLPQRILPFFSADFLIVLEKRN